MDLYFAGNAISTKLKDKETKYFVNCVVHLRALRGKIWDYKTQKGKGKYENII